MKEHAEHAVPGVHVDALAGVVMVPRQDDGPGERRRDRGPALIEVSEVETPSVMVEDFINNQLKDMENRFKNMGLTMKQYLLMTGENETSLREKLREGAIKNVKSELLTDIEDRKSGV